MAFPIRKSIAWKSRWFSGQRFKNSSWFCWICGSGWNHATDAEFLGNGTFNDETGMFHTSYGTVEDGVATRVGVSIKTQIYPVLPVALSKTGKIRESASGFWGFVLYNVLGLGSTYKDEHGITWAVNKDGTIGGLAPTPGIRGVGGIWSSTRNANSVRNALDHWIKHGKEFSNLKNAKQYVEAAKNFLTNSPAGTLTKVRANGDILKYHPNSNTFAVMNSSGVPKTMFKPTDGINYWNAQ